MRSVLLFSAVSAADQKAVRTAQFAFSPGLFIAAFAKRAKQPFDLKGKTAAMSRDV